MEANLKNFYIAGEQSVYLLSANDAQKHRDWVALCEQQLNKLGFEHVSLIGKGAFGFVFVGTNGLGQERVFKFSRITLPQNVRDRLEEEGYMLSQINHPNIPGFVAFQNVKKQGILVMERGQGVDLHELCRQKGRLSVSTVVKIAIQLADILKYLRRFKILAANGQYEMKPIVHGDIKPSNLMWDENTETLSLIDWGSCVFAQLDENRQPIANNIMDLMSTDMQNTNARLGDIYFIGEEQLGGALSSPRFDEQGAAATLYAIASNLNSRYGYKAIPPSSLGLPRPLAIALDQLLSADPKERDQAGDRFVNQVQQLKHWVLPNVDYVQPLNHLPIWSRTQGPKIETVVYSSRKSFLRQHQGSQFILEGIKDAQLDKYYKNYLQGMGNNEKAFVAAVSRLGEFPIVGGLAIHWQGEQLSVESNLNLFDESFKTSAVQTVDSIIDLARSLDIRSGIFKSCLFDAKDTIHVERKSTSVPFVVANDQSISFDISDVPETDENKQHSYFEDGDDPDEKLVLPAQIMEHIIALNDIRHTGCIIFEVLPKHLKIHNYYVLLDKDRYAEFKSHLQGILDNVQYIDGLGVSGFMKLPYKDTKTFDYQTQRQQLFCPTDTRMLRE